LVFSDSICVDLRPSASKDEVRNQQENPGKCDRRAKIEEREKAKAKAAHESHESPPAAIHLACPPGWLSMRA
jgi:hypothetical protein